MGQLENQTTQEHRRPREKNNKTKRIEVEWEEARSSHHFVGIVWAVFFAFFPFYILIEFHSFFRLTDVRLFHSANSSVHEIVKNEYFQWAIICATCNHSLVTYHTQHTQRHTHACTCNRTMACNLIHLYDMLALHRWLKETKDESETTKWKK